MNKKLFSKKVCRKLCLVLFTLLFSSNLWAENSKVKELIGNENYDKLLLKGTISYTKDDGTKNLVYLPKNEYSEIVNNSMVEKADKSYPFTYEGLYLISKKTLLEKGNSNKSAITIDDISTVIRSISKMQGMKYYSTTKKKEDILYKKTYMVEKENSNKPIADQNTGNAEGQISYCMQDDSSFGVNHYKLVYKQNEDTLLSQFLLTDNMGVGPFVAIKSGKMVINIVLIDCDDDILLYLNTDVECIKFPGIKGQLTDSLTSRMDAVYKWFLNQF